MAQVISPAPAWLAPTTEPAEQDARSWFADHRRQYRLEIATIRVTSRDGDTLEAAWPGGDFAACDTDAFGSQLLSIAQQYKMKAAAGSAPRRRSIFSRLFRR
jgi:hypothetical protein